MDVLQRIVAVKRAELERERRELPPAQMIELASRAARPRDFVAALRAGAGFRVIAEIKRASPSRGTIRADADVAALARAYAGAGAAALSVLTERQHFLGEPGHVAAAKEVTPLPVLRKDFILDDYHVYQSRMLGADAYLLIARLLEPADLGRLIALGRSLHMEPLVETHSEDEIRRAADCGAAVIGVNNRDLATLQVNLETSLRLAPALPDGAVRVSESGIETHGDVERLRDAGYHAFLVGERLMRDADPAAALSRLLHPGGA